MMPVGGGWVLEVDIRKFFDTLDHAQLRKFFVRRRVRDGVLAARHRKVAERGRAGSRGASRIPETGTPQGGVISPLLANIYLHESWTGGSCARCARG